MPGLMPLLRAINTKQQDRRQRQSLHQEGNEIQGEAICPMEVLKNKHQGTLPGQGDKKVMDHMERLIANLLWIGVL